MSGPVRPTDTTARPGPIPASLRNRLRPVTAAEQRTLPVLDALGPLLPGGLPRGVTLTTTGDAARSLAFALTAAASQAGSWLAVLGLDGPGWQAAAELGVATDRVVHIAVDDTTAATRAADCIAAASDGFDLVLVGSQVRLTQATERRLRARARERGSVLIGVHEHPPNARRSTPTGPFAAVADLRGTTRARGWHGLGAGTGHLSRRSVEVVVEGKRLPGRQRSATLWIPGPGGTIAAVPASAEPVRPSAGSHQGRPGVPIERSA